MWHTQEGRARNLTAQVWDVNEASLSLITGVKAVDKVVFGEEDGNYIEDMQSKERMYIEEEGGCRP